jgi:hypothetical protein
MDAAEIYTRTIENLRRSIEQHQTPGGRASVKAFAEAYGFSRQNLVEVLGHRQELSVGLFLKLTWCLKKGGPVPVWVAEPEGIERWSLRTWLELDGFRVHSAMYDINFQG